MICGRLIWLFAAGFVIAAVPLFFLEAEQDRQLWAGLAAANLGGFALAMACDGWRTGKVEVQYRTIERATHPQAFRLAVAFLCVVGLGTLCAAVWMLFFRSG